MNLHVRKLRDEDIQATFEISNQPAVRDSSFQSETIRWEDHQLWFKMTLADPTCHFYVAEIDGIVTGQVRFKMDGAQATVSISIDSRYLGMGIGEKLYRQALSDISKCYAVNCVVAMVKRRNIQSISFFQKLGFVRDSSIIIDAEPSEIMVSRLDSYGVDE